MANLPPAPKPVEFVGSAEEDLAAFPRAVKLVMGFAIFQAQIGRKHQRAKPLTGHKEFRGASVLEVVNDHDGNTYRAMYTIKLADVVYVLHAFQKKSKHGVETTKHDIELIKRRLAIAKQHFEEHYLKKREAT